jgi:hypothetical protein
MKCGKEQDDITQRIPCEGPLAFMDMTKMSRINIDDAVEGTMG